MAGTGGARPGAGRKSVGKEKAVIEWYVGSLPKAFGVVDEMLESKNKKDRLWAVDWLKTGLVKMIPQIQKIGGDKDNDTPIPISLLQGATQNVSTDNSPKEDTPVTETP